MQNQLQKQRGSEEHPVARRQTHTASAMMARAN